MTTAYLYLLLCAFDEPRQCAWQRQPQAFATHEACSREGARRVEVNRANISGHFMFIECRPV